MQMIKFGFIPRETTFSLMGTGMPSQQVNRREREAELSPPSSAEVKIEWSYTSVSTLAFMTQT